MHHPFVLASFLLAALLPAQQEKKAPAPADGYAPTIFTEFPVADGKPLDVDAATAAAIAGMLRLQEGDDEQWPYEGVYREDRGQLPVGYRVGGTAIGILGMVAAPGYRADADRKAAVTRGLTFVLDTLENQRMTEGFEGTYDVRGWGHIYALTCFLQLQDHGLVPKALADRVADRTGWLVKILCGSAIPQAGGWNYSRRRGYLDPRNTASTFMTAPALQALFHAKARGYEVDEQVVQQALDALERARSKEGGYAYGAPLESRNDVADEGLGMMDKTPSAAARATACETTLMLAGRGDKARLQKAIELFFAHWDDLAVRKSRTGTHIPPYDIAPYYFLFGHVYCAQAIEMLDDEAQRADYRSRLRALLARSREADGTWNDRQFPRSAGYGTAMALLVMHMPGLPRPFAFAPAEAAGKEAPASGK
ncbi:MAG: terpene cyclase/mutase family protein [Planctomycetes bacterium]|nr:terpene cyclase/mutase family protein [Planctomycetota bacterium]